MTQAFNLSQLANGVNTSGQLNAAANLYNQVPVANGGTNASSFTGNAAIISNAGGTALSSVAAGANGNVLTSNGTTWTSAANPAATGVNTVTVGTASGTWTKPATVKSIKVTVVGGGGGTPTISISFPVSANVQTGGGGGGTAIRYYPAASLPGPQPYTVATATTGTGGTSSFGVAPITVVSATGGAVAVSGPINGAVPYAGVAGGSGTNGNINVNGQSTNPVFPSAISPGGASLLGFGGSFTNNPTPPFASNAGNDYGGGAGGRFIPATNGTYPGSNGGAGVVIIEEFY